MNKILIQFFVLVFTLSSFPFAAYAAAETETPKCSKGINKISIDVTEIISLSSPTSQQIENAEKYINECADESASYAPDKRAAFRELIRSSLETLDKLKLSLLTESVTSTDGTVKVANNKKLETIKALKTPLELAALKLNNKLPLDKGWGKDFVANFYLGYEGTSVAGVQEKGTIRTGLMVYNQFTKPFTTGDPVCFKKGDGGCSVGVHVFGNAFLSSSAEESNKEDETDVNSAFEFDVNTFVPFLIKPQSIGIFVAGPIASFGLRKVDSDDEFTKKYYGGLRFAHSPESFMDVLYGKTEGVTGKRLELKGQLPAAEMLNGTIFVGGSVNIGVKDAPENSDNLRLYVIWQVRFSDIFDL